MIKSAVIVGTLLLSGPSTSAETGQERVVRLAELEIDSAHLESTRPHFRRRSQPPFAWSRVS